ncbi:hypothetical protein Hanom_Chr08g00723961 [Helianthus anomalus]
MCSEYKSEPIRWRSRQRTGDFTTTSSCRYHPNRSLIQGQLLQINKSSSQVGYQRFSSGRSPIVFGVVTPVAVFRETEFPVSVFREAEFPASVFRETKFPTAVFRET